LLWNFIWNYATIGATEFIKMQSTDKKTFTASKILLNTLSKIGIKNIFGYPGSAVLSVYDELSKQNEIKHYLFRHEQSAVHAAEGYSRVSGNCGVVLVTSGPGASNTITGIANAYLDGYPLIVIAGQVSSDVSGRNSFQELNYTEIAKPCSKAVFKISTAEEIESTILQAYLIATSGKKGPVVIEIPKNIFQQQIEYKNLSLPYDKFAPVNKHDIDIAFDILKNSKNPVVVCGGGVVHSNAYDELMDFVELTNIPVVSTMMGIGAFSQNHPKYAGMIGLYGEVSANNVLKNSDTILVLGARFNDRITSAFDIEDLNSKNIIQVDINSAELIKNLKADLAVNADIKDFLSVLNAKIEHSFDFGFETQTCKRDKFMANSSNLTMAKVASEFSKFLQDKNIMIAAEVGQHQISLIKNFEFVSPLITSGGLGTMGFGFCAAIGASIALDKSPIVVFAGDGSFQMNSQELAVCKQYGLPVKIFVMNNKSLGLVRQTQDEQYSTRFETDLINPDFVKLSESYGVSAIRIDNVADVNGAFEKVFSENIPYVVEFITDENENV